MNQSEAIDLVDRYAEKIAEAGVPKRLYKFRSWGCERPTNAEEARKQKQDRLILTDQTVWFASPLSFNDPFDCKLPYRYDRMSAPELLKRISHLVTVSNPGWNKDQCARQALELFQKSPIRSANQAVKKTALEKSAEYFASRHGILSFSGTDNNILLWSHYADMHRGYCVELDGYTVAAAFFHLFKTDRHIIQYHEVHYRDSLPEIVPTNDAERDYRKFLRIFTTKYSSWHYEDEHRFIYLGRANLCRSVPKSAIKRVILGCQMPDKAQNDISELVGQKLPETEVWKALRSVDRFELEFTRM